MIKRELIVNLKSFLIYLAVLVGMFLFVYLLYPFILTEETLNQMDELLKAFPEEFLSAFNMDMSSLSTAYGWLKSEGFVYVLLILGIYSSILGSNILLKEESDKTIEYLSFLPIKRAKIVTNKIIAGLIYIVSMIVIFGIFNFVSLLISDDLDKKEFLLLSICPLFVSIPLFALNLFLSTFTHKTKKLLGISLGLVFFFYIVNAISEMSENVEFLKYFSLYSLSDIRGIIANGKISIVCIIVSIVISASLFTLTYIRYNKKELI